MVSGFMGKQQCFLWLCRAPQLKSFVTVVKCRTRKACAFYPHLPKMGTFYLGHKYDNKIVNIIREYHTV